jgi:hypothetical protein
MKNGQDSARTADTNGLKQSILEMICYKSANEAFGLKARVKTNHGFHHEATGSLLCPVTMDWDDAA